MHGDRMHVHAGDAGTELVENRFGLKPVSLGGFNEVGHGLSDEGA